MATVLTANNFKEKTSQGVALVDFYTATCPPCRMIAPVIEQLAGEYEGKALVAKVDAGADRDLALNMKVMNVPTIIIMQDGKEVERIIGARPKAEFAAAIDRALEAAAS